MTWTAEKVRQIPQMYCDALLALKPIIDTRNAIVRIRAVPLRQIFNAVAFKHNLTLSQVKNLARNLAKEQLIRAEDDPDFYVLTEEGEDLVRAIAGEPVPEVEEIPPFPKLVM